MARKVRKRKVKPTGAVKITQAELRFPGEARQYWMAVGGVVWACLLVAGSGFYLTKMWQWVYLAAWPIGSLLIVNWVCNRPRRKQLKEAGPHARVMGTNYPELYRQLKEVADCLGVRKLPQMYVVDDEAPYIYSMAGGAGSIIVTKPLLNLLRREELSVMLARELAHLKYGHVRLERALYFMKTATPAVAVALGPLALWGFFMGEWLDIIEYTADRAALLVAANPSLVNATIVKVAAAADPQADLTPEDIEDFLAHPKGGDLDARLMERQFQLNRFIESQPNLRDRIEQVAEFYQSEEGKALIAKVQEAKAKLPPT